MPEDIPEEEPHKPAEQGTSIRSDSEPEKGAGPYKLDFLVAIISGLFPFGWSVSGFPPSIALACVCWLLSLLAFLHYFWNWCRNTGKCRNMKWPVMLGLPTLILAISWRPVVERYRAEHFDPSPQYELRINDPLGAPITNGALVDISESHQMQFWIRNTGATPARNLSVQFEAPIPYSELSYPPSIPGWEEGFIADDKTTPQLLARNVWTVSKEQAALPPHSQYSWGTPPLTISTNVYIRLFSKKDIESFGFEVDMPTDELLPYMPATLTVYSDDNQNAEIFFLFIKL